jgi:UDP-2,3-diacylglucosamine pyrophosphatase LpxH
VITATKSEKLVVISDLHLGNPFSQAKKHVIPFLRWAAKEGYDICINGDGLEIAQASFNRIAFDVPEFFKVLGEVRKRGREIYYVTGNHDIALEHFLEDWGMMKVSPFLNVDSGQARIRIEHGHIYDPFFVKHPVLYEALTHLGGIFLKIHPSLYRLWISFEKMRSRLRARKTKIVGEHPSFREAALELNRRGFDAVIFGHTHHYGSASLEHGGEYFNPGSWMLTSHYVLIESGRVSLQEWKRL